MINMFLTVTERTSTAIEKLQVDGVKSQAIVTLADANYFELLQELISSIKQQERSNNLSICVLDAGLTDQQVEILKALTGGSASGLPANIADAVAVTIDLTGTPANQYKFLEQLQVAIVNINGHAGKINVTIPSAAALIGEP